MIAAQTPSQALMALGLTLPAPTSPTGEFVGVIKHGLHLTVFGQVPLEDGKVLVTGRLGETVSIATGQEAARICMLNILTQLAVAVGGLDNIIGFVRLAGYVAATPEFTEHGQVIDAASKLLGKIFGERAAHARVALGVSSLPSGVPVEIELTALC